MKTTGVRRMATNKLSIYLRGRFYCMPCMRYYEFSELRFDKKK